MRMVKVGVKTLVIGYVLFSITKHALDAEKGLFGEQAPRAPLYGIYEVQEFVRNGQSLPPLLTDAYRWRMIVFQFPSTCVVKLMDDSLREYPTEYEGNRRPP